MTVIKDVVLYFRTAFGIDVTPACWKEGQDLPFFMRELYIFHEISLLGKPCIVFVPRGNEEIPSGAVVKHFKQLQAKWRGLCIYARSNISPYHRRRLIEHRIPFVVPNNQLYFPDLGIDLTEHFQKERASIKILSPPTQAVIIYALCHGKATFLPSELAKELHYTRMTMTRAFDELKSLGIGDISQKGKERRLYFRQNLPELWKQVKSLMSSPVKKSVWLRQNNKSREMIDKFGLTSGVSALAQYSMLNHPLLPVYAIDIKAWKKERVQEVSSSEEADVQIELWSYNPKLFENEGLVDPFSLYLSLHEMKDERVEAALEKLLEDNLC
jgi:DNA-binding MarR family transcriptional regulator